MTDYKLVPVKQCAACGNAKPVSDMETCMHNQMHRYVCDSKCMNDFYNPPKNPRSDVAAPAVQGEPVGWVTEDTVDGQAVNGKPRRVWWENNEGVGMPIYTAPQPAPDVSGLVEALEAVVAYDESVEDTDANLMIHYADMMRKVRAALSAHRRGGDEA